MRCRSCSISRPIGWPRSPSTTAPRPGGAREGEVVKEERRFRTDNDIDGMMDEAMGALAFLAHPYRWPIVGWMTDLDLISRQDCERYFRTYYAPNNCTLVLVGDFDTDAAYGLLEKLYSKLPAGEPLPAV